MDLALAAQFYVFQRRNLGLPKEQRLPLAPMTDGWRTATLQEMVQLLARHLKDNPTPDEAQEYTLELAELRQILKDRGQ